MPPLREKVRKQHVPTAKELKFRLVLGQRIRDLRTPLFSQDEFADAIDVYRSHMSNIERGKSDLKLSTLLRVAEALDMTVGELLDVVEGEQTL
jgi:transcriptional regulator with XRE-family HTH domain